MHQAGNGNGNHITTASVLLEDGHNVLLASGFRNSQEVHSVMIDSIFQIGDLSCTHEEADTGMILHAVDVGVIIASDDTDVLVLFLYYCCMGLLGNNIYIQSDSPTSG